MRFRMNNTISEPQSDIDITEAVAGKIVEILETRGNECVCNILDDDHNVISERCIFSRSSIDENAELIGE